MGITSNTVKSLLWQLGALWNNALRSQIYTVVAWCSFSVKFCTVSLEFRAGHSFCIFSINETMQPKAANENQKKDFR